MKKVLSVLTALVLVLALAIPAFAGSITIKPNDKVSPIDGRTFTAYKVLNATRTGDKIVYSVPDGAKNFMATRFNIAKDDVAFSYKVAEEIRKLEGDDLMNFATAVINAIEGGSITPLAKKTGAASGENYVIEGLDEGYYVIQDNGTKKPVSALMLATTDSNQELIIKADVPSVDKKIGDSLETGVESNNAAIGDTVNYVIGSTVPRTVGYSKYTMVFRDTLSDGLTYNEGSLKVYIDGTEVSEAEGKYNFSQNGQKLTVTFADVKGMDGKKIEIKYTATVNENAVIGVKGNDNTVKLEYSNNPTDTSSKDETKEEKTRTFVTQFKVNKIDASTTRPLEGVKFTLKGTKLNTVILTDKNDQETIKKTTEEVVINATTDSNGNIIFTGLSEGEYTLTEIETLAGYNILPEPIKITIGWTAPANDTADCTWTYKQGEGESATDITLVENVATITVENQGGAELPSTGGIGTTIFYVVGGLLVVGAAVLLVTRRKVALEK